MEMASIGFLLGAVVCLFGVLVGRLSSDRDYKGQSDADSDIRTYIPVRDRDRSCRERIDKTEMMAVLGYFQLGAAQYERKILEKIMEVVERSEENERF